jgi:DNA primase
VDAQYDINDDVKRDVLAATDLVSLIGGSTSLKKIGASWKGLCPFHGEKTPSFYVHPAKGFYYCFGCGAKGDAITFVRETERMEFPEAVAYLARLAGVSLPVRRGGSRADRSKETRGSEAVSAAARFFHSELARHAGARQVLEKRGLTLAQAEAYGFGAAPEGWEGLKSALAGFTEEVLVEAGLLTRNPETGRVYDRFRNRLTVEIRDPRGEVLGFGARALGDEQPKYLNSPESSRFSKGRLLYGLDRAREAIRTSGEAILCEGYFDRIAFERAGLAQAVASMGTALTPQQTDLLARHAPAVTVAYDGDDAGRAAARKAFALLVGHGVAVKHLLLPGGHDPDSFLREKGPEALRDAVGAAVPVVDSLLSGIPAAGGDPNERAQRIGEAKEILSAAPDRLVRYELLSGLSRGAGIPLEVLTGEGKKPRPRSVPEPEGPPAADGPPEIEQTVFRILVDEWPASAALAGRIPAELFNDSASREILAALAGSDPGRPLDFSELESHVGARAGLVVARLLLQEPEKDSGTASGSSESDSRAAGPKGGLEGLGRLHKRLLQLKIRQLEERVAALQSEIRSAERAGDSAQYNETLTRKLAAVGELARLKQELRRPSDSGKRD